MKIRSIEIQNFRLLSEFKLEVEEKLSVIIGKNNTGKTSLLTLMNKFLNRDIPTFTFDDFNLNKLSELKIISEEDIPENFKFGIQLKITIEYFDSDDFSIVSPFMMNLSPDENKIVIAFNYFIAYQQALIAKKDFEEENDESDFMKFFEESFTNYFKNEAIILEYGNESNFIPLENRADLKRLISLKSISAKRSVDNQSHESDKEDKSLSRLASKYYEKIEKDESKKEQINQLKSKLKTTDIELTTSYGEAFKEIISKVKLHSGLSEDGTDIKIISDLDGRNILKDNTTVKYIQNGRELPENYNGLGYMNLFELIFQIEVLLNEFKKFNDLKLFPSGINLLYIEEPEAHTHPQMQYVFIKNIKRLLAEGSIIDATTSLELQTIISTHSSHITSESDFNDIKYFYKNEEELSCKVKNLKRLKKLYAEDPKHFKFLKQYLTLTRAELFFADKVVLIEGDTERILMPTIMKKLDLENDDGKMPLLSQNISIVEVGAYSQIFEKFIDFLEVKKTLIITDIDSGKSSENNKACRVADVDADVSTNSALTTFFGSSSLPDFLSKNIVAKTLEKKDQEDSSLKWEVDENGRLCIVYQVEENGVCGRSFEESFININRPFITDEFRGVKNFRHFADPEKDAYDLADECINKKTYFALDIIFQSTDDYSNWNIPAYIKEGLLWLKQ